MLRSLQVNQGAIRSPLEGVETAAQMLKSWVAVIYPSDDSHYGHGREFLDRAEYDGHYEYEVADLATGDAVEFCVDYAARGPKGGKTKRRESLFGVVRELTPTKLVLEECPTAEEAFRHSALGQKCVGAEQQLDDMERKLAVLRKTRDHVNVQISELERLCSMIRLVNNYFPYPPDEPLPEDLADDDE